MISENHSSNISCIYIDITFTIICTTNNLSLISFAINSITTYIPKERIENIRNIRTFFPICLKYWYSLS